MQIYHQFKVSQFSPEKQHLDHFCVSVSAQRPLIALFYMQCMNYTDLEDFSIYPPLLGIEYVGTVENLDSEAAAVAMAVKNRLPDLSQLDNLSDSHFADFIKLWLAETEDKFNFRQNGKLRRRQLILSLEYLAPDLIETLGRSKNHLSTWGKAIETLFIEDSSAVNAYSMA